MAKLMTNRPPVAILGVPFDNVTCAEAVELIEGMIESRQPHYLVTANVDFLTQAEDDVELRRILRDAHLVLCDGTPLVWASRFLGNPLPERVAGADLVPQLIRVAAEKGHRIFFLGATPDSAEEAVCRMRKQYPGLVMAGHYSPPFNRLLEMDHGEIKRRIHEAKPDLLFVAFGCPKAEKWIAMHYQELGVPVVAGVGATIDFLAGRIKRAPKWVQRAGAEWLFRLAQEPRRLARRYGKDMWVFGRRIAGQWVWQRPVGRKQYRSAPTQFEMREIAGDGPVAAKLRGRVDVAIADDLANIFSRGRDCLLDLSEARFIDSTGVALLIRLRKQIRSIHRHLVLVAPAKCVQRALAFMKLDDYFDIARDARTASEIIAERQSEEAFCVAKRSLDAAPEVAWLGEISRKQRRAEVWSSNAAPAGKRPSRRLRW